MIFRIKHSLPNWAWIVNNRFKFRPLKNWRGWTQDVFLIKISCCREKEMAGNVNEPTLNDKLFTINDTARFHLQVLQFYISMSDFIYKMYFIDLTYNVGMSYLGTDGLLK